MKAPLHSTGAASRLDGVAPRSNTAGILPRHALSPGRITRLGATRDFHHGLLGDGRRRKKRPGPGVYGMEWGAGVKRFGRSVVGA